MADVVEQLTRAIRDLQRRVGRLEVQETVGRWVNWTPTIDQGGAVTSTTTSARAFRLGKKITLLANVNCTSAGTAGNGILIAGLPANVTDATGAPCVGAFQVNDKAATVYAGSTVVYTATQLALRCNVSGNLLGADPAYTIANGDDISFVAIYEVG